VLSHLAVDPCARPICQEAFYGKEVILSTREMVETESDEILRDADKVDVSFLVVGDPFG
jgi:diphthine synthase